MARIRTRFSRHITRLSRRDRQKTKTISYTMSSHRSIWSSSLIIPSRVVSRKDGWKTIWTQFRTCSCLGKIYSSTTKASTTGICFVLLNSNGSYPSKYWISTKTKLAIFLSFWTIVSILRNWVSGKIKSRSLSSISPCLILSILMQGKTSPLKG